MLFKMRDIYIEGIIKITVYNSSYILLYLLNAKLCTPGIPFPQVSHLSPIPPGRTTSKTPLL